MTPNDAAAKVGKLRAVTVERGATPAEAATAASRARRLTTQLTRRRDSAVTSPGDGDAMLAPGVHVDIL